MISYMVRGHLNAAHIVAQAQQFYEDGERRDAALLVWTAFPALPERTALEVAAGELDFHVTNRVLTIH